MVIYTYCAIALNVFTSLTFWLTCILAVVLMSFFSGRTCPFLSCSLHYVILQTCGLHKWLWIDSSACCWRHQWLFQPAAGRGV